MSVHAGIIDRLKTDGAISVLLGGKIFPESAPSDQQPPYATVHVDGDTPWRNSDSMVGTKEASLDVEIVADSLAALDPISRAVESRLPLFSRESRHGCTLHGISTDEPMTTDVVYRQGGQEKHLLVRSIPARAYYSDE